MLFDKTIRALLRNIRLIEGLKKQFHMGAPSKFIQFKQNMYRIALITSATAIGFSVYIAHNNKIKCDTTAILDDATEEKSLHEKAILKSRDLLQRMKDEFGIPGVVVGVCIDGKNVWKEGLGYADVENRVLCSSDTVMRIASISKSITATIVAKLWEEGQLNIDKPIQEYIPSFPLKTFNGKPVTITCRYLLCHLSGIRHYEKSLAICKNGKEMNEFDAKEYLIKEKYNDIQSALTIFQDDPLLVEPGTKFLYTTHGWTVVSAIVEAITKEPFPVTLKKLFKTLGMQHTYLDENDALIYHRSRNYVKNKQGLLINAPYVDNSCKWAGGGLLSTVGDLLQFGNAMLYSLQIKKESILKSDTVSYTDDKIKLVVDNKYGTYRKNQPADTTEKSIDTKNQLPGYLNSKTVEAIWSLNAHGYGLGWKVVLENHMCQFCKKDNFSVYHTGGAIGASSVLRIVPKNSSSSEPCDISYQVPKGTIVVIFANLQNVKLVDAACKIAELFDVQQ